RRLKSVVLLGITGYGLVVLFALHGAPDLALTQALVETVTIVVFVLVLRRLPAYYSNRPLAADRWWRVVLAVAVALVVMAVALVAPGYRVDEPIWPLFPDEAYTFGYGKNVVNVTLVDIRAWDTMGEISVLLAAATGIASLIFLRTRSGGVERARDARAGTVWAEALPQKVKGYAAVASAMATGEVRAGRSEERRVGKEARCWGESRAQ